MTSIQKQERSIKNWWGATFELRKLTIKTIIPVAISTVGLFGFLSCEQVDCLDIGRQITEGEKQFIPIQANDTIYYTNKVDTFKIVCIARDYTEETDNYIDMYYQNNCVGGLERRYWQLSTKCISNIPYMDTSGLTIKFNVRSSPYLEHESIFDVVFNTENVLYSNHKYSLYLNPDTPNRLTYNTNSNTFNDLSLNKPSLLFQDSLELNNQWYKNVNVLSGTIEYFDSVYYNKEYGILRITKSDLKLNIIKE